MSGGEIIVRVDRRLADLLPRFVAQCRREAAEIRRAVEAENLVAVRAIGHVLTGAGGGYGIDEISRLGREIEQAASSGEAEAVLRLAAALDDYAGRLKLVYD